MGSATLQGELWGAKPHDWTELGEPPSRPAWNAVHARAGVGAGTRVADLGCGAGGALLAARERGATVAGLDASEALVEIARGRLPGARIELGDLENLPFEDATFDVVTGFNSFQFASDIPQALREARRVARPGGSVAMCVWASREECESVMHTIGPALALLGTPPPASGPPLSAPGVVEGLMQAAGLAPRVTEVVDIPFEFADVATAWRCYSSAGIIVNAIRTVGENAVRRAVLESLRPFTRPDGSVLQKNRFRWVLAARV